MVLAIHNQQWIEELLKSKRKPSAKQGMGQRPSKTPSRHPQKVPRPARQAISHQGDTPSRAETRAGEGTGDLWLSRNGIHILQQPPHCRHCPRRSVPGSHTEPAPGDQGSWSTGTLGCGLKCSIDVHIPEASGNACSRVKGTHGSLSTWPHWQWGTPRIIPTEWEGSAATKLACHSIGMTFRDLLCEAGGIIILTWPRAPEDSQGRSHIHTVPRSSVILGFEVSQSQHRNGVNGLLLSKRPSSMS